MTAIHGLIQTARGMCTDERPYTEIDELLGRAVDAAKYVEAERDELRITLDVCDQELDMEMALSDHYRRALVHAEKVLLEAGDIDEQDNDSTENMVYAIVTAALNQTRQNEGT